jgi:hypothetical protein
MTKEFSPLDPFTEFALQQAELSLLFSLANGGMTQLEFDQAMEQLAKLRTTISTPAPSPNPNLSS